MKKTIFGVSILLLIILILRALLINVIIPYTAGGIALKYKEINGSCPDVDVDKIIDDNWNKNVTKIINRYDKGFINKTIVRPIVIVYKKKGDLGFYVFKRIYHWRSGC